MNAGLPVPIAAIKVVMCDGDDHPLGTPWRFKATRNDFYIEPLGSNTAEVHLSVHGPTKGHPNHRFHIKVREQHVETARQLGHLVAHALPESGHVVPGRKVDGCDAYLVMRIRWDSSLRDALYVEAARMTDDLPEIADTEIGGKLNETLEPGFVWDLDLFVSFGAPYWPAMPGRTVGDPRLGPLVNDKHMYVTVLSVDRDEANTPAPEGLVPALPDHDETPARILVGGPDDSGDIYWWIETIMAKEIIDNTRAAQSADADAESGPLSGGGPKDSSP